MKERTVYRTDLDSSPYSVAVAALHDCDPGDDQVLEVKLGSDNYAYFTVAEAKSFAKDLQAVIKEVG